MRSKVKELFKKIATNKQYGAELRLISTGTLLVIVFLTFFNINGTLGWLSSNNEVSANGMSVSVRDLSDFKVTLNSYAVPTINGLEYEVSTTISHLLPTLDPSGIVYSPNEKALVVLITLETKVDTIASLTLEAKSADLSYAASNFFSNCIKITPATISGTDPQIATREADSSSRTFVTVENNVASKVAEIPLVESLEMRADETITLCFVIEYYETAVSMLFAGARDMGAELHEINFLNDIEFIIEHAE